MDKKTSFALENFKNIQELIKFIDQKAGAIIVIYIFILTAFIEVSKNLTFINPFTLNSNTSTFFSCVTFLIGITIVGLMIYQLFYILFKVVQPKMAQNYCKTDKCLYYFDHIASMEKSDFMKRFNNIDPSNLLDEITSQIYEVAKILSLKSKKFSRVIHYLYASMIALLAYILCSNLI